MNLTKWNYQPMLSDFFEDFERRFYSPFKHEGFIPAANIKETEKTYDIQIAAPGMKKEDFKIGLENNVLTISSEKQTEKEEETEKYTRKEFVYGAFSRSFTWPRNVDSETIKASYEDGILKIELPKRDVANLTREIKIL